MYHRPSHLDAKCGNETHDFIKISLKVPNLRSAKLGYAPSVRPTSLLLEALVDISVQVAM